MPKVFLSCTRCGKPLSKRQVACRQKYCSQECFHNSKSYDEKKCLHCGKVIPEDKVRKHMGDIKYCSTDCYFASMRATAKRDTCLFCGKLLNKKQIAKGQNYCSRECRNNHLHPDKYVGTCIVCGKSFDRPVRGRAKYCSNKCRKDSEAYKKRCERIASAKRGKPRSVDTIVKLRNARIKQIGEANLFGGQVYPCYNASACDFFDEINRRMGINGLHAKNGGEYRDKDLGYWYDYYCQELKVIIEWDEEKHFSHNRYRKKDIVRNETITKHRPDHLLVRVRQSSSVRVDDVVSMIVAFTGIQVGGCR